MSLHYRRHLQILATRRDGGHSDRPQIIRHGGPRENSFEYMTQSPIPMFLNSLQEREETCTPLRYYHFRDPRFEILLAEVLLTLVFQWMLIEWHGAKLNRRQWAIQAESRNARFYLPQGEPVITDLENSRGPRWTNTPALSSSSPPLVSPLPLYAQSFTRVGQ